MPTVYFSRVGNVHTLPCKTSRYIRISCYDLLATGLPCANRHTDRLAWP